MHCWGMIRSSIEHIFAACTDALAVLLPVTCSGCGAADESVCRRCRADLLGGVTRRQIVDAISVYSAARYEDRVARVIGAFKDGGRTDAAGALAVALRQVLGEALTAVQTTSPVLLVPVPSSPASVRRRGYRPLERVASRAGLKVSRVLSVRRRVRDQASLGAAERASNLERAFVARRQLVGLTCIIFDDVVTSGATLRETARALRAAGALVSCAVVLAATPRRAPGRPSMLDEPE
jgi:predicted amidophosphoribosyltransferase